MNKLLDCFLIECKKLLRSRIPLLTTLALTLVPFMAGFFMFVLKNPGKAQRLGFVSAKAQLMGDAHWASYMSLLAQAVSVGGLLVFGFIFSWVFGREYSHKTIKDLLALPISRSSIVLAKYLAAFLCCFLLALYVFVLGILVGKMVDIPGGSPAVMLRGTYVFAVCSLLSVVLSTPVGFMASLGRGYLSPLGFTVFTLVLAQVIAAIGYGEFFPWSIPAVIAGLGGGSNPMPVGQQNSIIIVLVTGILGVLATIMWWEYADEN